MNSLEKQNINIEELANYIFCINENTEIILDIKSLKTNKEFFFFCFDLFCKGLVLLFGENNKLLLNNLTENQFDIIKLKFKYAHIFLHTEIYDIETAHLIDIIDKDKQDARQFLLDSIDNLKRLDDNLDIKEYNFNILLNDNVISLCFTIN
jgi:hypothetical protein